jgi:hypothetical protein
VKKTIEAKEGEQLKVEEKDEKKRANTNLR